MEASKQSQQLILIVAHVLIILLIMFSYGVVKRAVRYKDMEFMFSRDPDLRS